MQVGSVFDAEEQTLPRRKKLWVRHTSEKLGITVIVLTIETIGFIHN
jgi:hypothetical protein